MLIKEVENYLRMYSPRSKANRVVTLESESMDSSNLVNLAYIKSRTIVSASLAAGGLIQSIVGALLLNAGLNSQGTATLKIMGVEASATSLGGIVLTTSVMWAYFAFLARPQYSSRRESKRTKRADGSSEEYEFVSDTQTSAGPTSIPPS